MTNLRELLASLFQQVDTLFSYFGKLKVYREAELRRQLTDNSIWASGIRRFEKQVELDEVKFAFEQAEKRLNDTIEDSQRILSRVNIVITIYAGSLVFLGGHIGAILLNKNIDRIRTVNIDTFIKYHVTFIPACVLSVTLILLLFKLAYHLLSINFYSVGSQPKDLFVREYYQEDNSELSTIIKMYLGELESYQDRVTRNLTKNKKRWSELNFIIYGAIAGTVYAALILLFELLF